MTAVYLSGGPADGRVVELTNDSHDLICMPDFSEVRMADLRYEPDNWPTISTVTRVDYRRSYHRCGRQVYTVAGEAVFEYMGSR